MTPDGTRRATRLVAVDVARCVALAGMIAVHVIGSQQTGAAAGVYQLAGGRSSALFALLAGVGLALVSGGPDPARGARLSAARRGVLARCLVVAAVGLTLGGVPTPAAVILVYYAALFAVAVPVLGWGPGPLAALAAGCAVATPVISHTLRAAGWGDPTADNLSWDALAEPGQLAGTVLLTGYYPVLTWTTYLFAGLAVGRLPLRSPGVARALALTGGALAAAAWLVALLAVRAAGGAAGLEATLPPSAWVAGRGEDLLTESFYGTTPTTSWWWLGIAAPHSGSPPDLVHTTGTALLVLGLALLVVPTLQRARAGALLLRPVVAAGAMTLTLYSLHVVALGVTRGLDPARLLPVWPLLAGHVLVALGLATLWGSPARRGPLEELAAQASAVASGRRAGPPTRDGG